MTEKALPLTEERRQELLERLATEPSDTKLSNEFQVSRKMIWRMRQAPKVPAVASPKPIRTKPVRSKPARPEPVAEPMPNAITPPAPSQVVAPVVIPATPSLPHVPTPSVLKVPGPVLVEDPRPKVDVEPVHLSTYFAVQLLRGESFKHVANVVLSAADEKGNLFRKLQVLDIVSVGATAFVRFRADMQDCHKVLSSLSDRGNIVEIAGSYNVRFTNGRSGKYPASTMCAAPKVGFGQTYAGTRIKRWKQQFAA